MKTRGQESSGVVGRVTPCAPPHENEKTARRGLARPTFTAMLLLLVLVPSLHAQSYSIDWYKIAGGGTSTGGVYAVSGIPLCGTSPMPARGAAATIHSKAGSGASSPPCSCPVHRS